MKLVIAVVQDQDKNILSDAFYEADIRATKLSSTGGFLRSGNTTFIIGIEEERVDEVLELIKVSCQAREQFISSPVNLDVSLDVTAAYPVKVKVGGATVFVLPIDEFLQF
ncbi:cyclic-di-AMP receptor [Tuanshanicoccus lijuaniae]|uniref:cyclic-di-AMP receptor n=1 Tax=Aerococcaceae bacterium zg-1292 TaxID=2774330 RepID=UPI0019355EC8|nr:cyclic-di-AMP receptor [Aerococcaceae bacterium zg-1292]MBF6625351.1 cyclic-di-AMP receptor [Aerococcaceae bacterium zg-BR9]MBF6979011.1 cyclic-di-AMP receptor [Aerococcaceae bacterium zg-BR22]MBS4456128.1 cyclic-di-AMP receptor [Aerococcaceae bacterium zg-A91]MBS4457979.1 cyclic-di-AMP receptor [Aerococcaceae bacterium zg-BR33]